MLRKMNSALKHYGKQAIKVHVAFAFRAVGVPTNATVHAVLLRNKRTYATGPAVTTSSSSPVAGEENASRNKKGEEEASWEDDPVELQVTLYKDPLSQKWDEKRFQLILNAQVEHLTILVGTAMVDIIDFVRNAGSKVENLHAGEAFRMDKTIALKHSTRGTIVYSKCCIAVEPGEARAVLSREATTCAKNSGNTKILVVPDAKHPSPQHQGMISRATANTEENAGSAEISSRDCDSHDEIIFSDTVGTISKLSDVTEVSELSDSFVESEIDEADVASSYQTLHDKNNREDTNDCRSSEVEQASLGYPKDHILEDETSNYPKLRQRRAPNYRYNGAGLRKGSRVIRALFPQDQYQYDAAKNKNNFARESVRILTITADTDRNGLGSQNFHDKNDSDKNLDEIFCKKTDQYETDTKESQKLEPEPGSTTKLTAQMIRGTERQEEQVQESSCIPRLLSSGSQTSSPSMEMNREYNRDTKQTIDEQTPKFREGSIDRDMATHNEIPSLSKSLFSPGNISDEGILEQDFKKREERNGNSVSIESLISIAEAIEAQCQDDANNEAIVGGIPDSMACDRFEYLEGILKRVMRNVLNNTKRKAHAEKAFQQISEKYGELLELYTDATVMTSRQFSFPPAAKTRY